MVVGGYLALNQLIRTLLLPSERRLVSRILATEMFAFSNIGLPSLP